MWSSSTKLWWERSSGSSRCWLRSSSNNSSLPEELLEEILSRLPVKSLIRFRCVKKSWSTNFQQPSFIDKHFRNHCDQANPSILVESNLFPGYGLSLHPYPDDDDFERFRIVDFQNDIGITELQHINMISCVNGVICLGGCFNGGFDGFVLWNPAIRKRKVVSYPSPPGAAHILPSHHSRTFYAFGYDQYFNDFKVVRIVTYNKKSTSTQNSIFTDYYTFSHVYSLKADSWTQVIDPDIHRSNIRLITRCYAIYFNGFHHWLGFLDNGDRNELKQNCDCEIILSFDMSNDVFRIMRLPDEVFRKLRYPVLDNVSRMNKIFSVFNDRLAFIVYEDEDTMTEKYFDIWVMREYGVEDSWTKQLVVGPLLGIEMPLQFAKNGELLLVGDNDAIVLYNIGSKEIRNLQLTKFPKSFIPVQAMVYVESLFSFPDIMACGACKIMKKICNDNCCFAEFFRPQDTEKFEKLRLHYPFKFMRQRLSDANTTKEDKERFLQVLYACVDAKGKEKQAGLSSSKNEKKELQASKCQAASSNGLGCKDTCLFTNLFSHEAKERMVDLINKLGMEMVKTGVCGACKIMKKICNDNCCFAEFFRPQDTEKFEKLKLHYPIKFMREMLSDANTTKEYKERYLQELYARVDAKGKEKQAGSSSSKNKKKELQATNCQAALSNELGCKDTCLFADLFSPEANERIVEIINEQGMEMVKTRAACGACKIMKRRCKDNCCFAEFFRPQDMEKFQKLKLHYPVKFMREMLSDANTTKEYKERFLQELYACVDAKGKEKQAGLSSSRNKKKELQASKCQAASSNELGFKGTCLFADLFSPEAKERIVEIINEQGMEMVETKACGACKIMRKRCKNNCCFAEFFRPQDTEKFEKLNFHYPFKFMRKMLSDANITKEDKERFLQELYACVDAKGEEKQAGLSSSKNEKKELQASKCQAASSNELECKDTCLFAALFSPEAKERIVEIIYEQGMEMVETEVKLMLEKLCRITDDEEQVAMQILLELKQGDQQ